MTKVGKKESIKSKIANATGKQLFSFMRVLKNENRFGRQDTRKYLKLTVARAKELNSSRFGSWAEAKLRLNQMPYPHGIFDKVKELLPVLGYQVFFQNYPKVKSLVIINPKLNCAYIRDLMNLNIKEEDAETKIAKSIFNS